METYTHTHSSALQIDVSSYGETLAGQRTPRPSWRRRERQPRAVPRTRSLCRHLVRMLRMPRRVASRGMAAAARCVWCGDGGSSAGIGKCWLFLRIYQGAESKSGQRRLLLNKIQAHTLAKQAPTTPGAATEREQTEL